MTARHRRNRLVSTHTHLGLAHTDMVLVLIVLCKQNNSLPMDHLCSTVPHLAVSCPHTSTVRRLALKLKYNSNGTDPRSIQLIEIYEPRLNPNSHPLPALTWLLPHGWSWQSAKVSMFLRTCRGQLHCWGQATLELHESNHRAGGEGFGCVLRVGA